MLTQARLKEIIEYNPDTGIAFWKIKVGRMRPGDRVGFIMYGSKRSKPYRYFRFGAEIEGKTPFTHIVHLYMTGRWPEHEMDHIHGDTLDDRWTEIRESTREQNEANRGPRKNNRLGIKGVRQTGPHKFTSEIYRKGVHRYLGTFDTPQDAHAAYTAAAAKHDGELLRAA